MISENKFLVNKKTLTGSRNLKLWFILWEKTRFTLKLLL